MEIYQDVLDKANDFLDEPLSNIRFPEMSSLILDADCNGTDLTKIKERSMWRNFAAQHMFLRLTARH
jgi:hypothetical protein